MLKHSLKQEPHMVRKCLAATLLAAVAVLDIPADATTINTNVFLGTLPPSDPYFYVTTKTTDSSVVNAAFGHTISSNIFFDDTYSFTLPLNGLGSGSVSASFSSLSTFLQITDVKINGLVFTASEAGAGIGNIPIIANVPNTIEVDGSTGPNTVFGIYDGTTTFTSSAVPEAATWVTFIFGFSLVGLALRTSLAGELWRLFKSKIRD